MSTAFQRSFCCDISNKLNLTECNDRATRDRKQLKGFFLEHDKAQMANYVRDLERTVQINKEIVSELLSAKATDSQRGVVDKLNRENADLLTQLNKVAKERDDVQAKQLICEQIIEELQNKDCDCDREAEDQLRELRDQLSRKEYAVQQNERRYKMIEELLMKYARNNQELFNALADLNLEFDDAPRKMSNVVDENEDLRKRLAAAERTVSGLQSKLDELASTNRIQAGLIDELKKRETQSLPSGTTKVVSIAVPPLDFSRLEKYGELRMSKAAYIHRLEESVKSLTSELEREKTQGGVLAEKNKKLSDELENLFKTNEKLSAAVKEASSKFDTMTRSSSANCKSQGLRQSEACSEISSFGGFPVTPNSKHSGLLDSTGRNLTAPTAKRTAKLDESFDEISSVEEVVDSPCRGDVYTEGK